MIGKLYHPNRAAFDDKALKVIINQGGTSSGKTYTILQLLFVIACTHPNLVITVVGQDIPNLKKGAIRDAHTIQQSEQWLKPYIVGYNKSDRIYEFTNGSIIEFNSYTDEQDAKSGKRDILFLNEANGVDYMAYWQLAIRTRWKIFIDYNPTAKFWVHENLIGQNKVRLVISDHRSNIFLSEEQHKEIENIDDTELHKVYARGLTGKIHGLIYPNYQLITQIPGILKPRYGLDFGFNHKMALVETASLERKLFWNELIYQSEMTIGDLIFQMKDLDIGRSPIYCDSARPDAIEELKRAGFNAMPADKSVVDGIMYIKKHQLYITKNSKGLIKEIQHYKWKVDKKTGETIDEPVKFMDDACFVGETVIKTKYGTKKIAEIKQGDIVLTSDGEKKVLKVFNNGCRKVLDYYLTFDNKKIKITCTPNHLIKTTSGWKPISELLPSEKLFLASTSEIKYTASTKDENITQITIPHFIGIFGYFIMEASQQVLRFITWTKTLTTIISKTLNCFQSVFTSKCTAEKEQKKIQNGLKNSKKLALKPLPNGIKVKREKIGINNMLLVILLFFMKKTLKLTVKVVAQCLKNQFSKKTLSDFALINVKANGAETMELTTLKKSARNAENLLLPISTTKLYFAHQVVLKSIHGVPKGKRQVYDLCIEDNHEYFANEVLVHNCDAARYGSYTGRKSNRFAVGTPSNTSLLDDIEEAT